MALRSSRASSEGDPLHASHFQPQLRMSNRLPVEPVELPGRERQRIAGIWQASNAQPEQVLSDREDIEKLDRAMLVARKQVFAARTQVTALQAELAQARQDRYANPLVLGLAATTLLAMGGWLFQRRQLAQARQGKHEARATMPASSGLSNSQSGVSGFTESELQVASKEARQWIERMRASSNRPA